MRARCLGPGRPVVLVPSSSRRYFSSGPLMCRGRSSKTGFMNRTSCITGVPLTSASLRRARLLLSAPQQPEISFLGTQDRQLLHYGLQMFLTRACLVPLYKEQVALTFARRKDSQIVRSIRSKLCRLRCVVRRCLDLDAPRPPNPHSPTRRPWQRAQCRETTLRSLSSTSVLCRAASGKLKFTHSVIQNAESHLADTSPERTCPANGVTSL